MACGGILENNLEKKIHFILFHLIFFNVLLLLNKS